MVLSFHLSHPDSSFLQQSFKFPFQFLIFAFYFCIKKIIELYLKNKTIPQIADTLRLPTTEVGKAINDNKELILEKQNEENIGLFEKDKTIKTTDTIKSLHEATLKVVDKAMNRGDFNLALQAIKEAREQTKITMQKKNEFDHSMKENLIPKDFGEFFINKMKRAGYVEEEEDETKR